jgi:hypothetical protein
MFEVIKTINFKDAGFNIEGVYKKPSKFHGTKDSFFLNLEFKNCFPISETGYRSVMGIPVDKIPADEEIEKVILEVYHAQDRAEIKPPSLFDETPDKTSWEFDTETGEEQQTIFKEVKPETDKGEFVGDLFSYDEE